MAEARNAVAYTTLDPARARKRSASLSHVDVNYSLSEDLIRAAISGQHKGPQRSSFVWTSLQYLASGFQRFTYRTKMTIINGIFPSTSLSWAVSVGGVIVVRNSESLGLSWVTTSIDNMLPFLNLIPEGPPRAAVSVLSTATAVWLFGTFTSRQTLKLLLTYKGYLYDPPKHPRKRTILWSALVRMAQGFGKPGTYSYQSVLPRLPLPALRDTCDRYLESMRPILDDAEFDRMTRLAQNFQANEGPSLQRLLWLKSWLWTNYVTDWWERFVYLRGREPIMINSNFYVIDSYAWKPTPCQASRAALMVYFMLSFKKMLDQEALPPITGGGGTVPLCMNQYRRIFGTTRIPGLEEDELQVVPHSKHLAVLCRGVFYIMNTEDRHGRRLTARDLESQFEWILKDRDNLTITDEIKNAMDLPVMTAGPRTVWAQFRDDHMSEGVTRASLEAIERALFVVVLDPSKPEHKYSWDKPDEAAVSLIHGSGRDRWFDKSFNFVVFANGKAGLNVEHSWADAPVIGHMWEWTMHEEFKIGYDDVTGKCKAIPQAKHDFKKPLRLRFEINEEALETMQDVISDVDDLIDDLDLVLIKHDAYSKGFIKTCKMSPDAYIQAALQLAYLWDRGQLGQTYESSMTRLFREGRTETVRPVTMEIVAFVNAMNTKGVSNKERIALLRKATDKHQDLYKGAMCGQGVDRHLFALYVASVWREKPSDFLKEVLNFKWALSTSQTPYNQTNAWDLKNNPNKVSAGGGFGPVSDDGYGVSYIIGGEDTISFHVASKKSSDVTSSPRFGDNIVKALAMMKAMFEDPEGSV